MPADGAAAADATRAVENGTNASGANGTDDRTVLYWNSAVHIDCSPPTGSLLEEACNLTAGTASSRPMEEVPTSHGAVALHTYMHMPMRMHVCMHVRRCLRRMGRSPSSSSGALTYLPTY